jgi:hypothetical protein
MSSLTLRQIKNVVHKMDDTITPDDEAYQAAVIMLAALQVGANIRRVARFTGYPIREVARIGYCLRANGIWSGSKTKCDWFEKDGGLAFWLDVSVALGYMERV